MVSTSACCGKSRAGRVYAADETSSGLLQAVGVVVAGALPDRIGVAPILDLQALLYVGCGVAALFLLREPRLARAGAAELDPRPG